MTFKELQAEMVSAMKEKNRVKKEVLADIVTCAKNMAIEKKCKDNISEDIVTAAILKSKKVCQEQIRLCPNDRPDLLKTYKLCMKYIEEVAPPMMGEEEIRTEVNEIISKLSLTNEKLNKGIVMKAVMSQLKGKADGKLINKIATEVMNAKNSN